MEADDLVCLCFRVSKRKVVGFCRREKPAVASLVSSCLGAGTGCGWCVPFLKRLHQQCREGQAEPDLPFRPEEYARLRLDYRRTGRRGADGIANALSEQGEQNVQSTLDEQGEQGEQHE